MANTVQHLISQMGFTTIIQHGLMVKVIWDSLTSSSVTEELLKLAIMTHKKMVGGTQIVLVTEKPGDPVSGHHQKVAEAVAQEVGKVNQVSRA